MLFEAAGKGTEIASRIKQLRTQSGETQNSVKTFSHPGNASVVLGSSG